MVATFIAKFIVSTICSVMTVETPTARCEAPISSIKSPMSPSFLGNSLRSELSAMRVLKCLGLIRGAPSG
jgi:hypothetical protein